MDPSYPELLEILRSDSVERRREFLRDCPPCSMKSAAEGLIGSSNRNTVLLGVTSMVMSYCAGENPEFGTQLAQAAHALALEEYAAQGEGGPLMLSTLSNVASSAMDGFNATGRYREAVAFAEEVIPFYEAEGERQNRPEIEAKKCEALIELNRIDEAREALTKAAGSAHHGRLGSVLASMTARATTLPDIGPAPTMSSEEFGLLQSVISTMTSQLTKDQQGMNHWEATSVINKASAIFLDPGKAHAPECLKESLALLEPIERWAVEHGLTDIQNRALWPMYIALNRLERHSDAARSLQTLRSNLEHTRAGISNPLERAGVTAKYPFLFPALCQTLDKCERIAELLDAMEGAKGRAVADVLTATSKKVVDERTLSASAVRTSELMKQVQAHYLSFFVDEDSTLAVLVAKDGSLHRSGPIPVSKAQIQEASRFTDPSTWHQVDLSDLLAGRIDVTAIEDLAPLLSWLGAHVDSGLIEAGDHLCYSPDEHLHEIPIHYLPFRDQPLARTLSVSRTHGVHLLATQLQADYGLPERFVSVEVPGRGDKTNGVAALFHRVPEWLSGHRDGDSLEGVQATVSALEDLDLRRRLIHFATHGTFPLAHASNADINPFVSSGLVLSGPDGLPDVTAIAKGERTDLLLTPRRILDLGLDFTGSHVTLQACVTGLAREGIGGDALGLEWALLQAGSQSLLSTHWLVSAELSAEFCQRFYTAWTQGSSRAEAWHVTVRSLMDEDGPLGEPFAWAAFSLSGDWR